MRIACIVYYFLVSPFLIWGGLEIRNQAAGFNSVFISGTLLCVMGVLCLVVAVVSLKGPKVSEG